MKKRMSNFYNKVPFGFKIVEKISFGLSVEHPFIDSSGTERQRYFILFKGFTKSCKISLSFYLTVNVKLLEYNIHPFCVGMHSHTYLV